MPAWRPRRRSWSSTSGCPTSDCSRRCGSWAGTVGCSRSTARIRSCSTRQSPPRCSVVTCYRGIHATTRPPLHRGGRDGAGDGLRARGGGARPRRPPHLRRGARGGPAREGRRRPGDGRDLPALPRPDRRPLRRPGPARPVPASWSRRPFASPADRDALWAGLADGSLDIVATDHVPDRVADEKAAAGRGVPFNEISNGAPGIETLLTLLYSEGVAKGRLTLERMVDLIATTPAARFGIGVQGRPRPSAGTRTRRSSTPPRGAPSAPPISITRATTPRTRVSR